MRLEQGQKRSTGGGVGGVKGRREGPCPVLTAVQLPE